MAREPISTMIDMLRRTAGDPAGDHGFLFYETPDQKAFLSYRELDARARAIGEALVRRGYRPGEVAVLGLQPGLDFLHAAYGALYAGLTIAPAPMAGAGDAAAIVSRLAPILLGSAARLVLATPSTTQALASTEVPWSTAVVEIITTADLLEDGDADAWVAPDIDGESVAALLFTSGSTGRPKGVMMTHSGIVGTIESYSEMIGATADSTFVGWMPVHHAAGFCMQVIMPALFGAQTVLTPTAQFQRRPFFWLQLLSEHRATFTMSANFAFDVVARLTTDEQLATLDLSSVRVILSGAEPVRMDTIRRFVDRFQSVGIHENMFMPVLAMTEALVVAMKRPGTPLTAMAADAVALEDRLLVPAEGGRSVEIVTTGAVGPSHTLAIVDPVELRQLGDGQIGEIWISGPAVSSGYWQNPEATLEAFGNKLGDDGRTYLRTGDLGGLIDGELYITGRLKDLIIIRGRNLYPQDLEALATTLPGVGIGAAFELGDHPSDVGIVLEFDAEQFPDGDADPVSAIADIRSRLVKEFSLPSLAVALIPPGTLPRTASGKVQRAITRTTIENGGLELIAADGFAESSQRNPASVP
jgi:acyl-CoA synthetase (AMP-forming)/AMP-acid ligase II